MLAATSPTLENRSAPREIAFAALLLAVLTTVFLWEPIANYSSRTFTTADFTQHNSLFAFERTFVARNQFLSDPVTQMVPWWMLARSELSHGRVPLWNPYNGGGAPLLGAYQSAVFSPFNVLFYGASMKFALLASAWLKTWLCGLFTFLFLRRLRLGSIAALVGATAFMFCGHNALLIAYPHSSVAAFLPAVLWCAESLIQRFEEAWRTGTRARSTGFACGLGAFLVCAAYAGHPETLCFLGLTLAAWCAWRLTGAWWRAGHDRAATARAARSAALFAFVAVVALLLAMPQILPFVEYLQESAKLVSRTGASFAPLPNEVWARYFFPNLFGPATDGQIFGARLPPPNYELANLAYAGSLILVLAALALPRALRDARTSMFAALALVWVVWAHDLLGLAEWIERVPLLRMLPIPVSQAPWLFALAVLAAFEVERWLRAERRATWLASCVPIALGAAALALFLSGARSDIAERGAQLKPAQETLDLVDAHLLSMSALLAVGLLLASGLRVFAGARLRGVFACGLLALVFAQTGAFLAHYQVTSEDRFVYPKTRNLAALERWIGDASFTTLSREGFPPVINGIYGLHQPSNYDALGVRRFESLFVGLTGASGNWQAPYIGTERALELFGIEFLLIRWPGVTAPAEENGAAQPHWEGRTDRLAFVQRLGGSVLYRYTNSKGRYWLVHVASTRKTDEVTQRTLGSENFDPYATVLLGPGLPPGVEPRGMNAAGVPRAPGAGRKKRASEADPDDGDAPAPDVEGSDAARSERADRSRGSVTTLDEWPTRVRLRVASDRDDYLVTTLAWYPGWKARIDGRDVPPLRANLAFIGLDVPAGEHEVELRYEPDSWTWGLRLALLGMLLAAFTALRGWRGERRAA